MASIIPAGGGLVVPRRATLSRTACGVGPPFGSCGKCGVRAWELLGRGVGLVEGVLHEELEWLEPEALNGALFGSLVRFGRARLLMAENQKMR